MKVCRLQRSKSLTATSLCRFKKKGAFGRELLQLRVKKTHFSLIKEVWRVSSLTKKATNSTYMKEVTIAPLSTVEYCTAFVAEDTDSFDSSQSHFLV